MAFIAVENDSGLMPKGDYECYVKSCEQTETKSGYPVIKFDFVVRSDIEQAYQGKHIFKNFYQDEAGRWPTEKIGKYANALGVEKGEPFELEDLEGRSCVVNITHFTTKEGETRDCIFYLKRSEAAPFLTEAPTASDFSALSAEDDDDLPF